MASMHRYNYKKTKKRTRRKTDYSYQKQHKQHENQQNENNDETKIWKKKTTFWTFQVTNKWNLKLGHSYEKETLKMKMKLV